jgi:hypothetical protein
MPEIPRPAGADKRKKKPCLDWRRLFADLYFSTATALTSCERRGSGIGSLLEASQKAHENWPAA